MRKHLLMTMAGLTILLQGSATAYDWKELASWEITSGASPTIVMHLVNPGTTTAAGDEVIPLDDTRLCEYVMTALTATKQRHYVRIIGNEEGFRKYQFAHFRTVDDFVEDLNVCNFHSFSIGKGIAADNIGHIRIDVKLHRLGGFCVATTPESDLVTFHCHLLPSAAHFQKVRFDYLVSAIAQYENAYTNSDGTSPYGIGIVGYDAQYDFTTGAIRFNVKATGYQ